MCVEWLRSSQATGEGEAKGARRQEAPGAVGARQVPDDGGRAEEAAAEQQEGLWQTGDCAVVDGKALCIDVRGVVGG